MRLTLGRLRQLEDYADAGYDSRMREIRDAIRLLISIIEAEPIADVAMCTEAWNEGQKTIDYFFEQVQVLEIGTALIIKPSLPDK